MPLLQARAAYLVRSSQPRMFFGFPFLVTRATTDSATTALLGSRCCHPGLIRPASRILSTSRGNARATMSPGRPSDTARACMQACPAPETDVQACSSRQDKPLHKVCRRQARPPEDTSPSKEVQWRAAVDVGCEAAAELSRPETLTEQPQVVQASVQPRLLTLWSCYDAQMQRWHIAAHLGAAAAEAEAETHGLPRGGLVLGGKALRDALVGLARHRERHQRQAHRRQLLRRLLRLPPVSPLVIPDLR